MKNIGLNKMNSINSSGSSSNSGSSSGNSSISGKYHTASTSIPLSCYSVTKTPYVTHDNSQLQLQTERHPLLLSMPALTLVFCDNEGIENRKQRRELILPFQTYNDANDGWRIGAKIGKKENVKSGTDGVSKGISNSVDRYLNIGGPIWSIAFAPDHCDSVSSSTYSAASTSSSTSCLSSSATLSSATSSTVLEKFLAVGTSRIGFLGDVQSGTYCVGNDSPHAVGDQASTPSLLQIWSIRVKQTGGHKSKKNDGYVERNMMNRSTQSEDVEPPGLMDKMTLSYCVGLTGPIWKVAWSTWTPYRCTGEVGREGERRDRVADGNKGSNFLGLIAVVCGDGSCLILVLPRRVNEPRSLLADTLIPPPLPLPLPLLRPLSDHTPVSADFHTNPDRVASSSNSFLPSSPSSSSSFPSFSLPPVVLESSLCRWRLTVPAHRRDRDRGSGRGEGDKQKQRQQEEDSLTRDKNGIEEGKHRRNNLNTCNPRNHSENYCQSQNQNQRRYEKKEQQQSEKNISILSASWNPHNPLQLCCGLADGDIAVFDLDPESIMLSSMNSNIGTNTNTTASTSVADGRGSSGAMRGDCGHLYPTPFATATPSATLSATATATATCTGPISNTSIGSTLLSSLPLYSSGALSSTSISTSTNGYRTTAANIPISQKNSNAPMDDTVVPPAPFSASVCTYLPTPGYASASIPTISPLSSTVRPSYYLTDEPISFHEATFPLDQFCDGSTSGSLSSLYQSPKAAVRTARFCPYHPHLILSSGYDSTVKVTGKYILDSFFSLSLSHPLSHPPVNFCQSLLFSVTFFLSLSPSLSLSFSLCVSISLSIYLSLSLTHTHSLSPSL